MEKFKFGGNRREKDFIFNGEPCVIETGYCEDWKREDDFSEIDIYYKESGDYFFNFQIYKEEDFEVLKELLKVFGIDFSWEV